MKAYDLNTPFTFGKYEGKTLEEVFETDPAYVEKCLTSVEEFAVEERSMQRLFEKYPDYEISDEAVDSNTSKLDSIESEDDDLLFTEEVYDDDFADEDEFNALGKGKSGFTTEGDDDFDLDEGGDDLFGDEEEDDFGGGWDDNKDDDY